MAEIFFHKNTFSKNPSLAEYNAHSPEILDALTSNILQEKTIFVRADRQIP